MSTIIEARRLNGTDLGKTIEFDRVKGELEAVEHSIVITDFGPKKYVHLNLDGTHHVLGASEKITITGKRSPEAGQ